MPRENSLPARNCCLARVVVCLATALPIAATAWSAETPGKASGASRLMPTRASVSETDVILKPAGNLPEASGLLNRYRIALEKESRRRLDRDAGMFLVQADDEDGNPVKRARTEAKRIFGGATGRLLGDFAELLVEDAVALQTATNYVQGIRIDVMNGGNMRFQTGVDDSVTRIQDAPARAPLSGDVAASFSLIALGSPRLEMRATLPGAVRTQIELPLTEPGLRATFSRRLTYHLRGTLSAGVEDSGADTWATVGLGVRF